MHLLQQNGVFAQRLFHGLFAFFDVLLFQGYPRDFYFFCRVLAVFILRDTRQPCPNRKFPAPKVLPKSLPANDLTE